MQPIMLTKIRDDEPIACYSVTLGIINRRP